LRSASSRSRCFSLDVDDAAHLSARQPTEQQDFVEPVEELGPEAGAHDFHHLLAHSRGFLSFGLAGEDLAAEIGGEDDERVL